MDLDQELLRDAVTARDRVFETEHLADEARTEYHHAIRRLHAASGSMREIARQLGLSHQRVHQIVGEAGKGRASAAGAADPAPRIGALSDEVSRTLARAQENARGLIHNYVGTEHLLLGLLDDDEGITAQALARADADPEDARASVDQIIGTGQGEPPTGSLRFTARSDKVLQVARREADKDGSAQIHERHLLLGLLGEGRGVGAQVLNRLGVDCQTVRDLLDRPGGAD